MIKIIKHGNRRTQPIPWRGHCSNCGCVFTADDCDTSISFINNGSEGSDCRVARCPDCSYMVTLQRTQLDEINKKMKVLEEMKDAMESLHCAIFECTEKKSHESDNRRQ